MESFWDRQIYDGVEGTTYNKIGASNDRDPRELLQPVGTKFFGRRADNMGGPQVRAQAPGDEYQGRGPSDYKTV